MVEVQAVVESFHAPAHESPENQYQRRESLRLVQVALDQLPPNYGNALEWKYIEGHSVQEIADRLDIGMLAYLINGLLSSVNELQHTVRESTKKFEEIHK